MKRVLDLLYDGANRPRRRPNDRHRSLDRSTFDERLTTFSRARWTDTGAYSKIHVFALLLASLHVAALALWIVLVVRQRPANAADRVDPSKDD